MLKKICLSIGGPSLFSRWILLASILVLNLFFVNRIFPMTEGWWETYGYLVNQGLEPFKDFDLTFSPIYVYFTAWLLKVGGNSFLVNKIVGLTVFISQVGMMQFWLTRVYSAWSGAHATGLATYLLMSMSMFNVKDYHTYHHFTIMVILLCLLGANKAKTYSIRWLISFALGIGLSISIFLKQNVGLLLAFSIIAYAAWRKHKSRHFPEGAILGAVILGLSLGLGCGYASLGQDYTGMYTNMDAKGSMSTIFLRIVQLKENREAIIISLGGALALMAVPRVSEFLKKNQAQWRNYKYMAWNNAQVRSYISLAAALLIAFVLFELGTEGLWKVLPVIVIDASLCILFLQFFEVIGVSRIVALDNKQRLLVFPLLALAYANTTTTYFDYGGLYEVIAFESACVLNFLEHKPLQLRVLAAGCIYLIAGYLAAYKIKYPYEWWFYDQASISQQHYEPDYPHFNNYFVDRTSYTIMAEVKRAISKYSTDKKDVYLFNLPMFYFLEAKLPPTKLPVHWFDVVNSSQARQDYNILRDLKPAVIVMNIPSTFTISGHRNLIKVDRFVQEDIIDQVREWSSHGEYVWTRTMNIPKHGMNLEQSSILNVKVLNLELEGLGRDSMESYLARRQCTSVKVDLIRKDRENAESVDAGRIGLGDTVTLEGAMENLLQAVEKIGVVEGAERRWNEVEIYVRRDRYDQAETLTGIGH